MGITLCAGSDRYGYNIVELVTNTSIRISQNEINTNIPKLIRYSAQTGEWGKGRYILDCEINYSDPSF